MLVLAHFVEGLLRQRKADEDRLELGDRNQRGIVVGVHEVALVDEAGAQPPVDRRADVGVAEIELGGVDLRLVALDCGLQLGDQRGLLVIALPGLVARAEELGIALEIELGAGQLGLVLLLGRLGLLQRRLVGPRIDLKQRLAFLDLLAFPEIDFDDLAVDPGSLPRPCCRPEPCRSR